MFHSYHFALAFLILRAPLAGAQQVPAVSEQDEIRAGDALLVSFKKSQGFADTPESQRLERYLQQVGEKVAAQAKRKLPYQFHLDPHPAFRSAVAYPGGHIVVGGGVLAMMNHEDELAAVLGHEIGHIDLDQCTSRLREAMQKHNLSTNQFDQLSIREFGAPYGKQGELDADREGMRLAASAGYSPNAMLNLLETFQFLFRDLKLPPRTDSPSLEERVLQAKDEMQKNHWPDSKVWKALELR